MESVFMKALRSAQKADEAKEKRSEEALDKSLSSRVSDEQIKKVLELEEKKVRRAEDSGSNQDQCSHNLQCDPTIFDR